MMKRIFLIIGILVLLLSFGCKNGKTKEQKAKEDTTQVIKIGAILPLTGDLSLFGEWLQEGILMAEDSLNKKKYKIIFYDYQNKNNLAINAFLEAVNKDKVNAIITTRTPTAKILYDKIKDYKIPAIFTFSDLPYNKYNPYLIIFHWPTYDEMRRLADYANSRWKSVGLVLVDDEYGRLCRNYFSSFYKGKIVYTELVSNSINDFKNILLKIKENEVDAILVVLFENQLLAFLKAKKELNLTIPILSPNSFMSFYTLVRPYSDNVYTILTQYNLDTNKILKNPVIAEAYAATNFLVKHIKDFSKVSKQYNIKDSIFGEITIINSQAHFPIYIGYINNNKIKKLK